MSRAFDYSGYGGTDAEEAADRYMEKAVSAGVASRFAARLSLPSCKAHRGAFLAGASCQFLLSPLAASPLPFAVSQASPLFLAGWLAVKLLQDALSVRSGMADAASLMVSIAINYALLLLAAVAFRLRTRGHEGMDACPAFVPFLLGSMAFSGIAFFLLSNLGSMAFSGIAFFLLSNTACFLQCADGSPCQLFPPMYPFTLAGYGECLMAGLPFLFRQMASSLCLLFLRGYGFSCYADGQFLCGREASRSLVLKASRSLMLKVARR